MRGPIILGDFESSSLSLLPLYALGTKKVGRVEFKSEHRLQHSSQTMITALSGLHSWLEYNDKQIHRRTPDDLTWNLSQDHVVPK